MSILVSQLADSVYKIEGNQKKKRKYKKRNTRASLKKQSIKKAS